MIMARSMAAVAARPAARGLSTRAIPSARKMVRDILCTAVVTRPFNWLAVQRTSILLVHALIRRV